MFVVTIDNQPLAVAATLEAAQADAVRRDQMYSPGRELRWAEKEFPEGIWRLQAKSAYSKRFGWTLYSVHEVEEVKS